MCGTNQVNTDDTRAAHLYANDRQVSFFEVRHNRFRCSRLVVVAGGIAKEEFFDVRHVEEAGFCICWAKFLKEVD